MTLDSNSAASDKEKAILFNQYFHSVFSTSSFPLPSTRELTRPNSFIDAVSFNELDVFKGLRALDVSKAMGCDGIGPMVLKHCAIALYQPFYHPFLSEYLPALPSPGMAYTLDKTHLQIWR